MLESPNIWLVLVLFIIINNDLSEAKKGHIGEERGDGRGWYGGSRGKYTANVLLVDFTEFISVTNSTVAL